MHTIKERLAYALTGESVIRALMRAKATMAYKDFGEVIGYIKPGEAWDYHRHTTGIAEILTLIAAAESQGSSSEEPLDSNVIISATTAEGRSEVQAGAYHPTRRRGRATCRSPPERRPKQSASLRAFG